VGSRYSEYFDGLGSWVVRDRETRQFVRCDDGLDRVPRVLAFPVGCPGERVRAAKVAAVLDAGLVRPGFGGLPGACGPVVSLDGLRSVLLVGEPVPGVETRWGW
jgi:hypothetical protein